MIKKLICKIFGHKYVYNFGWAPNRCKCGRCGMSWKTITNPKYIPNKTSPLDEPLEIWVEDNKAMNKKQNLVELYIGLALYMICAWGLVVLINYLFYKII